MVVNYKNEGDALTKAAVTKSLFCLHLFWDHGTKLFHFANPSTSFLVWKASFPRFYTRSSLFLGQGGKR